ncbi:hypothetical protein A3A68_01425 [Candidatus Saccharibacteria bacterium RIFCSPLOWO2_01_FULL_48_13]|nr:MAG: hypothetical protein A2884_00290 [Candidatus Saccharibacteria bacterium RIFCSPHIGHO2_01_FULL_48_12]OGL36795.1 MAG: hypothetical protein A3F38_02605 [Candidatus Saccharibacteria bacterium RIFCSPHIGHO2_12_FULL_48_21]OGL37374.1 MAG: hypothetical protein A3A68_01425 [Candidatus Saccharibacteria bacterium RIFCSPLOWO2_01_FULL_48_13]
MFGLSDEDKDKQQPADPAQMPATPQPVPEPQAVPGSTSPLMADPLPTTSHFAPQATSATADIPTAPPAAVEAIPAPIMDNPVVAPLAPMPTAAPETSPDISAQLEDIYNPLPAPPASDDKPEDKVDKPKDKPPHLPTSDSDELIELKKQALEKLTPLVGKLDQTPEEKFKTTMMLIQASDNADLVPDAYQAANKITDEKAKAQALLDVVNEINYFTQSKDKKS